MEENKSMEMCSCPYCGQIHMVAQKELAKAGSLEWAAALVCHCNGANDARRRKRAPDNAKAQIMQTFGPEAEDEACRLSEKALEWLNHSVPLVYDGVISGVKISREPGLAVKIGMNRSGNLTVESKLTETAKTEVSPWEDQKDGTK